MLKKTILGVGLAEAAKIKSQTHEHVPPNPPPQPLVPEGARQTVQTKAESEQTYTDGSCYPGVAKMYSSLAEADNSRSGSGVYSDYSFTGWDALYQNWQNSDEQAGWESSVAGWERVPDIDGADYSFWGPYGIRPEGVSQGGLGDCWFLSAASGLAEEGSRIREVFAGRGKQADGFYVLKFYVMGEPNYITIDDTLPVSSWGSPVNSARSDAGAWWLPLLEKAYAKFNQNYAAISGGWPVEAFSDMTGMPAKQYIVQPSDGSAWMTEQEILDLVQWADDKHFVINGAVFTSVDGLVSGHAYTVIGISDDTYNGEPMIAVRNPWSSESYYGPGSDQDDDGKFSMPLDKFREGFYSISVVYYADWYWTSTGVNGWGYGPSGTFDFNVDTAQDVAIQVELPSSRQMGQSSSCDQWSGNWMTLTVYGQYGDQLCQEWVGDWMKRSTCYLEGLSAGSYSMSLSGYDDPYGAEYNIRAFGMESPIHLTQNGYAVTESRESDYAAPAGRIGDDGVEVLDDEDEEYGGNNGEVCTAAGCISDGSSGGGGGGCSDYDGQDSGGDSCSWYDSNVNGCGSYDVSNSFYADTYCCACGGGWYAETEPVVDDDDGSDDYEGDFADIVDYSNSTGGCTDNSYSDSYGDGCDWYAANTYACGQYDGNNGAANRDCCACGGGSDSCADSTTATDDWGDGCDYYRGYPSTCGSYDSASFKANDECPVACGTC